jgi:hypothetical protein
VNEIHRIVQSKDEKQYVNGLMKIYESYVKEHKEVIMDTKNKDPETIEELERQLKYMEKCQGTLKTNTTKKEFKAKVQKKRKTSENRNLIFDLNIERARKQQCESHMNKLSREIQEEKLKIKRLELEEDKNNVRFEAF